MEQKTLEEFSDELKGVEPVPINVKDYVEEQELKDGEPLHCPFCDWKTHPNAKDKKRGLKNHMKKCKYNPENNEEEEQKVVIEKSAPQYVEDIVDTFDDEDSVRDKLLGDLDILKVKFPSIPFTWNYNANSSVEHLRRQKRLFLRLLNDEAGAEAVFNLVVIGSKAVEKCADVGGVNINGYANDVKHNKQEIYPILKQMVDTGVLDIGHLSPELRLGMIMCSLAINRLEENQIRQNNFLEEEEQYEP